MQVKFKAIEDCASRELVRLKFHDETRWALVAQRASEYLPIVTFRADGAAHCINVMGSMDNVKTAFNEPVLSYGTAYEIAPNEAGPFTFTRDASHIADGDLVRHGENGELSFACEFTERKAKCYYDVLTGRVRAAPGGVLAVYGGWTLSLVEEKKVPVVVIERRQK
jgi:hypothetical protein